MAAPGEAWRGTARPGYAGRGKARQERHGLAGEAWLGGARTGVDRRGPATHGTVSPDAQSGENFIPRLHIEYVRVYSIR